MARSTRDAWLQGPGDLEEATVSDVPVKGQDVKIRALSATAANAATSEAISTIEVRGQQKMKVDSVKLDILRFQHGVIEPEFELGDVTIISSKYGPAFQKVVNEIVRISGLDRDAINEADARFLGGGSGEAQTNGSDAASGHGRPDLPARSGGGKRDDRN